MTFPHSKPLLSTLPENIYNPDIEKNNIYFLIFPQNLPLLILFITHANINLWMIINLNVKAQSIKLSRKVKENIFVTCL